MEIRVADIKRRGITIILGQGRTATEGMCGNLPTLRIRERGKEIKFYRGSSLIFDVPLTEEDKRCLAYLGNEEPIKN